MRVFISFAILVACIIYSFNLRDPHFLFIREYESIIIALILLFTLYLSKSIVFKKTKYIIVIGVALLLPLILAKEVIFRLDKNEILNNPTMHHLEINKRLIVGFNDFSEAEKLVKNGIAGIFITKRNIENQSFDEIKLNLEKLKLIRKKSKLDALIIATDQEGGIVSRLSPLIKNQPPLSSVIDNNNPEKSAYEYGYKQGESLRNIGVNVNFSPVVDLKPNKPPGSLDFHTLIYSRAISKNSQEVINIAGPYIKGLGEHGVIATLKHFPGLNRVTEDTHHFTAKLNTPITELKESDWKPFIEIPKGHKNVWIMLGHVILPEIDPLEPVSTSQKVVSIIIRKELKYDGVLITDDLTMGATYNRGFCASAISSLAADINYILIAHDYEKYYDFMACTED